MKKHFLIVLLILSSSSLFGQQRVSLYMEILTETINAEIYDYYKFEIKPVSGKTTWCYNWVVGDWVVVSNATTSYEVIQDDNCRTDDYGFDICCIRPVKYIFRSI